ncbi:protein-L-isoaspartate(D-aspartate) O-methyltransferase [Halarchaeum rubridurum]|uniref:Protein-L-isoaspartate O-methyltransferase n=1 Tax=Halarchaeum rubridurum TaxID=489911 RepID=A0A830G132_9EURY|nr:protein-L-isoaspartate(D-aspartate) O-methyltransferase [Halarchaeum rubridurum]MBP1954980.1 protein-L-isoaspartate(D-aspartate) O-methyltransferase [Halarchaeum rubridurum]GGM69965.1 protein-L-isoaspartate O-methyltransferase [Halarchaeum rubridurum]
MAYEEARDRLADGLARQYDFERRVIEAIRAVPRHAFVPEARRDDAYADRPLPIGHDQTVSAPHMVAAMADHLALEPGETVLEIGTGCGYHAAVTAELVGSANVYSAEYVADLAADARENLATAGYGDVHVRQGDGREGWSANAPYDAVYLTCAAPDVPEALVGQTRAGGRVLAPVGDLAQQLVRVDVGEDGTEREHLERVRFVRMQ